MKIEAKSRSIVLTSAFLILFLICISSTALASAKQVSNSASGNTAEPYTFVTKWGSYGSEDGQFNSPTDVAVDSLGNVYVTDYNNYIQKFDSNGAFITKWGSSGSGDGQFNYPSDVAVDSLGNVYVADYYNNRIQKFDSNGAFITKWDSEGSDDGQFHGPWGVAVDSSDNVYVADLGNHRIEKFDSNGNFITKWGSEGSGDGQFNFPSSITVDSSNNVYVADSYNNHTQKFDSNGSFITKWGSEGSGDGQFNYPSGIAVNSSDNVYVADLNNNRIQTFDSNGAFITKWGSSGSGDGQFNSPFDVAVDSLGNVYVVDLYNCRIEKFAQIETPEPSAPIYNSGNGHYYESINVPDGITWEDAKNAAHSLSYSGMKGHLVTITTQGESDFLSSNPGFHVVYWIGGYQELGSTEPDQGWKWITGEDILSPTEPGFSNWQSDTGEPNNVGDENRLRFWGDNTCKWNDQNENIPCEGYIVEYEEQGLPVANFSTDVTMGNVPLSVQFTDLSENAIERNWNFGDGASSTEQSPMHTYSTAGIYTVNLTVRNDNGTDSKMGQITVLEQPALVLPVANFTTNITSSYAPLTVSFTDQSIDATKWNWEFGDGTNSTEQNPTHTYSSAGNYTVTLTVSNIGGIDSKLSTITVYGPVPYEKPETNSNATNVYAPVNVQIGNLSQNANEINWNIGPQHLGTNFSGNGQNVSAPVTVQIGNASQNATTINWNIYSV